MYHEYNQSLNLLVDYPFAYLWLHVIFRVKENLCRF